jgi:hypothetical protein
MLFRRYFSFIPFFNGNECGSSNYGSDVYIGSSSLSGNSHFLSCYSITKGTNQKRCYSEEWINEDDDWV